MPSDERFRRCGEGHRTILFVEWNSTGRRQPCPLCQANRRVQTLTAAKRYVDYLLARLNSFEKRAGVKLTLPKGRAYFEE